jgi:hypothetical protein
MKIHTLDREYCKCKKHPRKFKKRLSEMNRKFNEAMDIIYNLTEELDLPR